MLSPGFIKYSTYFAAGDAVRSYLYDAEGKKIRIKDVDGQERDFSYPASITDTALDLGLNSYAQSDGLGFAISPQKHFVTAGIRTETFDWGWRWQPDYYGSLPSLQKALRLWDFPPTDEHSVFIFDSGLPLIVPFPICDMRKLKEQSLTTRNLTAMLNLTNLDQKLTP